jgi:hypothetical protein
VALIRTDVSEDRIASIFRVYDCAQIQSEVVSSCIGSDSIGTTVKNFYFCMSSRKALGSTEPPIQWVQGALSPEVKQPGRESNHSPPNSAEVKKMWIYTSTLLYAFMA